MEIQSLRLHFTEQDVNALLAEHLGEDQPVRDLRVHLVPEGVRVTGAYPTPFLQVRFETLWSLTIRNGKVAVQLADLRVVGLPAAMLRGALMGVVSEAADQEDAILIEGETLVLDVDRFLAKKGLPLRTNLHAIHCDAGSIVVESLPSGNAFAN